MTKKSVFHRDESHRVEGMPNTLPTHLGWSRLVKRLRPPFCWVRQTHNETFQQCARRVWKNGGLVDALPPEEQVSWVPPHFFPKTLESIKKH